MKKLNRPKHREIKTTEAVPSGRSRIAARSIHAVSSPNGNTEKTGEPVREFGLLSKRQVKTEFTQLDKCLRSKWSLASQKLSEAERAIDDLLPILDEMQQLLSQRGTQRQLRAQGLPSWTEYYKKLCSESDLGVSLRWIQRKLCKYRHKTIPHLPVRVTPGEQLRLLKLAQANSELLCALENGAEFQGFANECRKLAVSKDKLQAISERERFDPPEFDYEFLLVLRNLLKSASKLTDRLNSDRHHEYVVNLRGEWIYLSKTVPTVLERIEMAIAQQAVIEGRKAKQRGERKHPTGINESEKLRAGTATIEERTKARAS